MLLFLDAAPPSPSPRRPVPEMQSYRPTARSGPINPLLRMGDDEYEQLPRSSSQYAPTVPRLASQYAPQVHQAYTPVHQAYTPPQSLDCAQPCQPSQPRAVQRPRRNTQADLTEQDLQQYFHLPMKEAANKLEICLSLLKKSCRRLGIPRWPARKLGGMKGLTPDEKMAAAQNSGTRKDMQANKNRLHESDPRGDDDILAYECSNCLLQLSTTTVNQAVSSGSIHDDEDEDTYGDDAPDELFNKEL